MVTCQCYHGNVNFYICSLEAKSLMRDQMRDGEEGGVSEVLEAVVEEQKDLEDVERKDELEEGVGVD